MNILIIDDSDYKISSLTLLIEDLDAAITISTASSFRSGLLAARRIKPDLILLDMSLPTFDTHSKESGGRTRPFGGREIMRELDETGDSTRVIVVTQFDRFGERNKSRDELMKELEIEFPNWFVGGVYYSVLDSKWREALRALLQKEKLP